MQITEEMKQKIADFIKPGLVKGLGSPEPGKTCIEGAISLALGETFSATPSCVAGPDCVFAIRINDARWSSPQARAEALLPLALAQLGTVHTDRIPWIKYVVEQTIRRIVPMALRAAISHCTDENMRAGLESAAKRCEIEGSREAVAAAASVATSVGSKAAASAARIATAAADSAAAAVTVGFGKAAEVARVVYIQRVDAVAASAAAGAALVGAALVGEGDAILREAVAIALEAYAKEGRA